MRPRFEAAIRALDASAGAVEDLASFRLAALAFKLVVLGDRPIAVAHALDAAGEDHWLAVRSAEHGEQEAYLELFSDLLRRGLHASRPVLVDTAGCRWLARRIDQALGPVVHTGSPRATTGVAS